MVEYHLECPDLCSLKEGTKWSKTISDLLAEGKSANAVVESAASLGFKTNSRTLWRHKRHIVVHRDDAPVAPARQATNIEILEEIIHKGFENKKNWKPTISDTMKAMDMWFRLTQGNPFDELLDTLAAASTQDDTPDENPAAIAMPDEMGEEDESV